MGSWTSDPRRASRLEAQTDLHGLDRLYAHDRLGDPTVQFLVPLSMRPQPKRQTLDTYLDNSTQRVACLAGLVDQLFQLVILRGIQ